MPSDRGTAGRGAYRVAPTRPVVAVCQSRAMSGRRIRLAVGVLGTIVALVAEAIALQAGEPPSAAMLHLAIGLMYLYGGLAIWGHEPANRTGRLMTAVGVTWFIGSAGARRSRS